MVTILISSTFRGATLIKGEGLILIWTLKGAAFIRGWRLLEAWRLLEEIRYVHFLSNLLHFLPLLKYFMIWLHYF